MRLHVHSLVLGLAAWAALLGAVRAQEGIRLEGEPVESGRVFFQVGKPGNFVVPPRHPKAQGLESVEFVYRPGSKVERREQPEHKGGDLYSVTPSEAALAKIVAKYPTGDVNPDGSKKYEKHEKVVSIRFATRTPIGLVVMILAGLALFGGAAFSIRSLLRSEEEGAG